MRVQVDPKKRTRALHSSSWVITSCYSHFFFAASGKRKFQQALTRGALDHHVNGHFNSATGGTARNLNSAYNGLNYVPQGSGFFEPLSDAFVLLR